jgi:hypothetical protein
MYPYLISHGVGVVVLCTVHLAEGHFPKAVGCGPILRGSHFNGFSLVLPKRKQCEKIMTPVMQLMTQQKIYINFLGKNLFVELKLV